MKKYKTIAGPQNIYVGKGNTEDAFNMFADSINKEASQGWTYHSMEAISVTEKPGCFQKPISVEYYMLIFEKEV